MAKCIREKNNPNATGKEFREALINAENALLLYLFVNLYTGDSKWCSLEEGNNLGEYWEQDPTQKPIPVYPDSWI